MFRSRLEDVAKSPGFSTTRLTLCLLWGVILLSAQVNGQLECTTYPCSISIAQYTLHTPPGAPGYTPPPSPPPAPKSPPPAPKSPPPAPKSPPPAAPSPPPASPTPKPQPPAQKPSTTSSTSSIILNQPHLRPPPPPPSSASSLSSNAITNSSTSATSVLSSSATSSPTTTQLRLPSFSSSSILPLITSGPSLNSTDSNSTSSTQCGQCSMAASQVQVYNWPTASVRSNCARASVGGSPQSPAKPNYGSNGISNATQTMPGLANLGKTDVINGFT